MDTWKKSFVDKLNQVKESWVRQFDDSIEAAVVPVFEELVDFLRDNGFKTTMPLREHDRRSFKFELAEDAYVLLIFRALGMGALEVSCELFVPGCEPQVKKRTERVADLSHSWSRRVFQTVLGDFVELLEGSCSPTDADSNDQSDDDSEGDAELRAEAEAVDVDEEAAAPA